MTLLNLFHTSLNKAQTQIVGQNDKQINKETYKLKHTHSHHVFEWLLLNKNTQPIRYFHFVEHKITSHFYLALYLFLLEQEQ